MDNRNITSITVNYDNGDSEVLIKELLLTLRS